MNRVFKHSTKLFCLAAVFAAAQIAALGQQPPAQHRSRLQIEELDRLAPKAEHVVEVTIPESLLSLLPMAIRKQRRPDTDVAKVIEIAKGFKGVYVRVFDFAGEGKYGESDIAGIRAQLKQPGWERIVSVRSRKDGQNVEVYMMSDPANLGGLAVIATQPDQLTVVNIVGKIDIAQIAELGGNLGIPELDIQIGADDRDDDERKPAAKRNAPAAKKP